MSNFQFPNPKNSDISQQFTIAEKLIVDGNPSGAITTLQKISMDGQPPEMTVMWDFLIGRAYLDAKQPESALPPLTRAVQTQKRNANFRLAYGAALHQTGNLEAAEKNYREAARLAPTAENPHFNLAKVLTDRGDITAAIRAYRAALSRKPNYPNAMAELADLLGTSEHSKEALDLLNQALNINPKHALSWVTYGKLLERVGEFAEASESYQKAVDGDPSFADGWYHLAQMALHSSNIERATECIGRAVAIQPLNEKYLFLQRTIESTPVTGL